LFPCRSALLLISSADLYAIFVSCKLLTYLRCTAHVSHTVSTVACRRKWECTDKRET